MVAGEWVRRAIVGSVWAPCFSLIFASCERRVFLHSAKRKGEKRNKLFRGQIVFVVERQAKFRKRTEFAIRFMLKTGDLASNSEEIFLRLQEE
jgi:hypothetical protein